MMIKKKHSVTTIKSNTRANEAQTTTFAPITSVAPPSLRLWHNADYASSEVSLLQSPSPNLRCKPIKHLI